MKKPCDRCDVKIATAIFTAMPNAATQVKKTLTGNGRASKAQMQEAVQRELKLRVTPEPHDVSDALAQDVGQWNLHP